MYFKADDIKKDKSKTVSDIMYICKHNNAGYGTEVSECVKFMLNNFQTDHYSVWLVLTDGEFYPSSLKKLIPMKNKVLFIVYNEDIKYCMMNTWMKWCADPNYDEISRCYIDTRDYQE